MTMRTLQEILHQDQLVVTAHRGWSARYPENTLLSLNAAADLGADLVEFDLRASKEGEPILLHDAILDRTTNGSGSPNDYTLTRIEGLNASYWQGTHHSGARLSQPAYPICQIPTFEQVLKALSSRIGMNIQVKENDSRFLQRVCTLYAQYNLYPTSYLTVDNFDVANTVRSLDANVALCVLQERTNVTRHSAYGCVACQPRREEVTAEVCQQANQAGMPLNMFWVDDGQELPHWINMGLSGVLTNASDVIINARARIVHTAQ